MFVYNVTVSIDESVREEWLNWMKNVHVPDVMSTGLFIESRILKVIDSPMLAEGEAIFAITNDGINDFKD